VQTIAIGRAISPVSRSHLPDATGIIIDAQKGVSE